MFRPGRMSVMSSSDTADSEGTEWSFTETRCLEDFVELVLNEIRSLTSSLVPASSSSLHQLLSLSPRLLTCLSSSCSTGWNLLMSHVCLHTHRRTQTHTDTHRHTHTHTHWTGVISSRTDKQKRWSLKQVVSLNLWASVTVKRLFLCRASSPRLLVSSSPRLLVSQELLRLLHWWAKFCTFHLRQIVALT